MSEPSTSAAGSADRATIGLTVSDERAVAVVLHPGTPASTIEYPATLWLALDGTSHLGEPAADAPSVASAFASKVGQAAGVQWSGTSTRAGDLVATAAFLLLREAGANAGPDPAVAMTYPDTWTPAQVDELRDALAYMGLDTTRLVVASQALDALGEGTPVGTGEVASAQGAAVVAGMGPDAEATTVLATPTAEDGATTVMPPVAAGAPTPTGPATTAISTDAEAPAQTSSSDRRRTVLIAAVGAAAVIAVAAVAGALALRNRGDDSAPATTTVPSAVTFAPSTTTAVTTTTTPPPPPPVTTRAPAPAPVQPPVTTVPPAPPVQPTSEVPPPPPVTTVPPTVVPTSEQPQLPPVTTTPAAEPVAPRP